MPPAPPSTPVQIIPWLAAAPSPLLWVALGINLALALCLLLPFRRCDERCPLSPRWTTVGMVVAVGFLAAISLGSQLANPVTVIAAPVFILASTAVAYAAWHAGGEGDARASARVNAASVAFASSLAIGCVLGCYWLLWLPLKARDARLDLGLGAGTGEAVALLLPAVGALALPLLLLPPSNPRSTAARRAVISFAGTLTLILAAVALTGITTITRPLPEDVALADRYNQTNAALGLPLLAGFLCALAAGIAALGTNRLLRLCAAAAIVPPALCLTSGTFGLPTPPVVGLAGWQIATCLAAGFLAAEVCPLITPRPSLQRGLLSIAAVAVCVAVAAIATRAPADQPGNSHAFLVAAMIAMLSLFAATTSRAQTAATAQAPAQPAAPRPITPGVAACCVATGIAVVCAVSVRASLTYQARTHSTTYVYESNRQVDPDMRNMLQNGPHAIHNGDSRWSWVMPQSIWWMRDNAWRDAAIIADYTQPAASNPVPPGYLYGAVITGPNRKRADIPFTDAQYVALIQPVPVGQKSNILHTVTARFLTPAQFLSWARIEPANPRAILGALAGCALAWWLTKQDRAIVAAAAIAVASTVAIALAAGVAGALIMLLALGLLSPIVATSRNDDHRSVAALVTALGSALLLMPVVISLAEVL